MTKRSPMVALAACAGVLMVITALIWYTVYLETSRAFRVVFLDVGQGDAVFVEAPSGRQMLIDGGRGKRVLRKLGEVMPFYDRSIDVLVATHPDADHIGGLPHVLARYDIGAVIRSGASSDTETFDAFGRRIEQEGARVFFARRGTVVRLGDGVHLDVLFPDRDPSGMDPNDASIAARLVYGDRSFMLTGDASRSIERYLVSLDARRLESSVLKAGHHGSKTSSARVFASAVNPEDVVISAGADNPYGHPHEEVLSVFRSIDTTIHRTSDGRVVFTEE